MVHPAADEANKNKIVLTEVAEVLTEGLAEVLTEGFVELLVEESIEINTIFRGRAIFKVKIDKLAINNKSTN